MMVLFPAMASVLGGCETWPEGIRPRPRCWSPLPGLNWRPRPYQGRALPTELRGPFPFVRVGAGNGIRTRDIQLGRLTLYQLSYSREERPGQGPAAGGPVTGAERRIRTSVGR